MSYNETLAKLLFVSRVKEGQLIVTHSCSLQQKNNYWASLWRLFYSESRHKTYLWITDIIDDAFKQYDILHSSDIIENKGIAGNMLANIESSKEGIQNMKKTYKNDVYYCSLLDTLLQNIDIRISARRERYI